MLLLLAAVALPTAAASSSVVYIIRHGEKTWSLGCLNSQGEARAASLPSTFDGKSSPTHATFQTPTALFANRYDDPVDCERCKQTLTPISQALNLTLNFTFGYPPWIGGNSEAASAIRNATLPGGQFVLVAWEHVNIQFLVADLGVDKSLIPVWHGDDYDTVYVLTYVGGGGEPFFKVSRENFTSTTTRRAAEEVDEV